MREAADRTATCNTFLLSKKEGDETGEREKDRERSRKKRGTFLAQRIYLETLLLRTAKQMPVELPFLSPSPHAI